MTNAEPLQGDKTFLSLNLENKVDNKMRKLFICLPLSTSEAVNKLVRKLLECGKTS